MGVQNLLSNGLSVGEVAGFIAGALSMVHLTLPLLLSIILIGVIQGEQHNAATWSVISNQLQNSLWPFLLQSDSSKTRHVRWRVTLLSWLLFFGTISAVVSSFLTPQPLTGGYEPESFQSVADFQYVQDTSYFGQGTPQRLPNSVNRVCGFNAWMNCPDSSYVNAQGQQIYYYNGQYYDNAGDNATILHSPAVNSTIPAKTADPFSSGTAGTTLTGPLDIEYRDYHVIRNAYIDGGDEMVYGGFRPLQILMLDDAYRVIEGAVVDTINGGVGFRNHSVPIDLPLGATWSEDILFVTPETSCANTNLTLRFSISTAVWFNNTNSLLQDDGGFANLAPEKPQPSWDDGDAWHWTDPDEPDLQDRAYKAAWWNNYWTSYYLKINESAVGDQYSEFSDWWYQNVSTSAIKISNMNGWYVNNFGNGNFSDDNEFTAYGRRCSGFDDTSPANASKPFIRCGYLYGIPHPADPGQSWHNDPGSNWIIPLYTCASAMKASVKEVTFLVNSTTSHNNSLSVDALSIASISDKPYASNADMPLWAVEKPPANRYAIEDINLFWGIVNQSHADEQTMRLTRAPQLYLPAVGFANSLGFDSDGFAAGSIGLTWSATYANAAPGVDVTEQGHFTVPNYSGSENFGLALKYRQLSASADGAAKIMNLIWTDLATWSFVGTATGFSSKQAIADSARTNTPSLGTRAVYRYRHSVAYKDFRYAIPAFITGFVWFVAFVTALFLILFRVVHFDSINHYVNQTSMGRTFTSLSYPGACDPGAKAGQWHDSAGTLMLNVPDSQARKLMRVKTGQYSQLNGGRAGVGGQKDFSDSDIELLQRGLSGPGMMIPEGYTPYFETSGGFPAPNESSSRGGSQGAPNGNHKKSGISSIVSDLGTKIARKPVSLSSSDTAVRPTAPAAGGYSEIRPFGSAPQGDYAGPSQPDSGLAVGNMGKRPRFTHQDSWLT